MTGLLDLESRSNGQYAPPVPLFVTKRMGAWTFPPRTMLWYFLTIEIVSSCHTCGPPLPQPMSMVASSTALTRDIASCVPRAKSTPDDWLYIMEVGDPTDSPKDTHLEYQGGRLEFQRRSTTPTQRSLSISKNPCAHQPLGGSYGGRLQAATLRWNCCHLVSSATLIPPSRWVPSF